MHQSWGQVSVFTDFRAFVRESLSLVLLHICFLFSSSRSLFFCRLNLHLFKSVNRRPGTQRYCNTATWDTLPRIAKKYFVICIRLALFLMLPQMSRGRKASQNACSHSLVTCTEFVFLLFWHDRENIAGVVWVYKIAWDLKIRGAAQLKAQRPREYHLALLRKFSI